MGQILGLALQRLDTQFTLPMRTPRAPRGMMAFAAAHASTGRVLRRFHEGFAKMTMTIHTAARRKPMRAARLLAAAACALAACAAHADEKGLYWSVGVGSAGVSLNVGVDTLGHHGRAGYGQGYAQGYSNGYSSGFVNGAGQLYHGSAHYPAAHYPAAPYPLPQVYLAPQPAPAIAAPVYVVPQPVYPPVRTGQVYRAPQGAYRPQPSAYRQPTGALTQSAGRHGGYRQTWQGNGYAQ